MCQTKHEPEEIYALAVAWGEKLQDALCLILPQDCFVKNSRCIRTDMLVFSPQVLRWKILGVPVVCREDICCVCGAEGCPWSGKISLPLWRAVKLAIILRLCSLCNSPGGGLVGSNENE